MAIQIKKLIAAVVICELAGIIGAVFTASAIPTWYQTIEKPTFNPPSWVFGPVWTTLYLMMGVALYIVWTKGLGAKGAKPAIAVFAVQLGLNTLWSIIFFGAKNFFLAFAEIILLWLAIAASIVLFYRIDRRAGLLLVPYILWVSFASVLTYSIWQLNG